MLAEQHIKTAMQNYIDCFNRDDLEGILSLYAEDAVVEDPAGSELGAGQGRDRGILP